MCEAVSRKNTFAWLGFLWWSFKGSDTVCVDVSNTVHLHSCRCLHTVHGCSCTKPILWYFIYDHIAIYRIELYTVVHHKGPFTFSNSHSLFCVLKMKGVDLVYWPRGKETLFNDVDKNSLGCFNLIRHLLLSAVVSFHPLREGQHLASLFCETNVSQVPSSAQTYFIHYLFSTVCACHCKPATHGSFCPLLRILGFLTKVYNHSRNSMGILEFRIAPYINSSPETLVKGDTP